MRHSSEVIFFDAGGTLIHLDYAAVGRICGADSDLVERENESAEAAARIVVARDMAENLASTDATRLRLHLSILARHYGVPECDCMIMTDKILTEHRETNLFSRPAADTAAVLEELANDGYRMAVISNADGRVEQMLRNVGLGEHLEMVIDSYHAGFEKPDPRIFEIACNAMGVRAEKALYVGDIYEIDVLGARAAGMPAILLDPAERWPNADCPRISSLAELRLWLEAGA